MIQQFRDDMMTSYVLFICEGGAEDTILRMLMEAGCLLCSNESIVGISRRRKAREIEHQYLTIDYERKLVLIRLVDSRRERFHLSPLFRDRYPVYTVLTSPEIEKLVIINEGRLSDYNKVKSRMSPSDFCKTTLGLGEIKRPGYLEEYWNPKDLKKAITECKEISNIRHGELCLADILK